jgi:D-alanyl-lipoteichoic acid acyltransferase DltB (MBOAT superfamily)
LLAASYFFYGCWDPRFLILLAFSTLLDYASGLQIQRVKEQKAKKLWLTLSVAINLGFLAFFKYYNFFAESLSELLLSLGFGIHPTLLSIILPVGISFYTFHGLSYVFDIYRGKTEPRKNLVDYALFVSFFPLLVAGPIERATHLLPQLEKVRKWDSDKAADGLRQILWGLIKKVLIADNCAQYASEVFAHQHHFSGGALMIGALCFMFEVYGDFSGYSDIALGTARLFGIELLQNFSYPYFSRSISEFWTRWHISLSSWFRDYVYIPLGGGRAGKLRKARNVMVVFLLSGFWHGASFNRIFWGGLHGLFMMPGILLGRAKKEQTTIVAAGRRLPNLIEFSQMLGTFLLCTLALIVFRTTSLSDAGNYLSQLASSIMRGRIVREMYQYWRESIGLTLPFLLSLFIITEWCNREQKYALESMPERMPRWLRWLLYVTMLAALFLFANRSRQFIYFQF